MSLAVSLRSSRASGGALWRDTDQVLLDRRASGCGSRCRAGGACTRRIPALTLNALNRRRGGAPGTPGQRCPPLHGKATLFDHCVLGCVACLILSPKASGLLINGF